MTLFFIFLHQSNPQLIAQPTIQAESMCGLNYLPICNGVIVSSHFWVDVVQVPLEILAF